MISKAKKYFTLYGMLAATVDSKLHSLFSHIEMINIFSLAKIIKIVLSKELKPIKLYSTNNI